MRVATVGLRQRSSAVAVKVLADAAQVRRAGRHKAVGEKMLRKTVYPRPGRHGQGAQQLGPVRWRQVGRKLLAADSQQAARRTGDDAAVERRLRPKRRRQVDVAEQTEKKVLHARLRLHQVQQRPDQVREDRNIRVPRGVLLWH